MRRLKLIIMTAVIAAALMVAAAGAALAERPQLIRCNEESVGKGAVGTVSSMGGTNPAGHQFSQCELAPPGKV
jgi:hypothetical protein